MCCAVILLLGTPSESFMATPPPSTITRYSADLHMAPLQAHKKPLLSPEKPLSSDAQRKLLDQVLEMRRIQDAEREFRLTNSAVTALALSRAALYGDDIDGMETALSEGEVAREQLITTNMALVRHVVRDIARKRRLTSVTTEDLVQEGVIGLVRAMDRWNPAMGTAKFSTYAVYWIRAVVLRYIAEKDSVIRVPEYVNDAISKVSRAARSMGWVDGAWKEAAAAKELAEAAGVSKRQLEQLIRIKNRKILSFETWAEIEKATVCEEELPAATMRRDHTKEALSKFLGPREVEAISWRYGLNSESDQNLPGGRWGESMSFAQVGEQMKVSAEYGRRLCHQALEKLRAAAEDGSLEPALLSI